MARPISLPGQWKALAVAAGGVGHLALTLRVDPATVWRWAHGYIVPTDDHAMALADFCRRHNLDTP